MPGRLTLLPFAPVGIMRGQLIENLYDLTPRLFSTAVSADLPQDQKQSELTGHIFAPAGQVIGGTKGGGTIFNLAWDLAEVVPYLRSIFGMSVCRRCRLTDGPRLALSSASDPPSIWADAVAKPQIKSAGRNAV